MTRPNYNLYFVLRTERNKESVMKKLSVLTASLLLMSWTATATTPASDHETPSCSESEACTPKTEKGNAPGTPGYGDGGAFGDDSDDTEPSVNCDFRC